MEEIGNAISTAACAFAQQWQQGTRLIRSASLDVVGNKFLRDIRQHADIIDQFSRGTGSALARTVAGYSLKFVRTGQDNCLDVDQASHRIIVNRDYFDTIANLALNEPSRMNLQGGVVVRRALRAATRSTVRLVVGHELFHHSQGLPSIAVVRQAARSVGWDEVARYDVEADIRGAATEASLAAIDDGMPVYSQVLNRFEDALAFQLRYCVPVFRCPPDKPHKRKRVASIALQLARIVFWNRSGRSVDESLFRALTMPIYVNFDAEYSCLGISGLDPIQFLGDVQFHVGELKEFFDSLDSGNVELLVKEAMQLNMRIGLLPVR